MRPPPLAIAIQAVTAGTPQGTQDPIRATNAASFPMKRLVTDLTAQAAPEPKAPTGERATLAEPKAPAGVHPLLRLESTGMTRVRIVPIQVVTMGIHAAAMRRTDPLATIRINAAPSVVIDNLSARLTVPPITATNATLGLTQDTRLRDTIHAQGTEPVLSTRQ